MAKATMREVDVPKSWPIHMHCFTDSWKICQEWSNEYESMKFGFTYGAFSEEVITKLSKEKILLETDAPYFIPQQVIQSLLDLQYLVVKINPFLFLGQR